MLVLNALKKWKEDISQHSCYLFFYRRVRHLYTLVNDLCYDFVAISPFNWHEPYEIYETPNHVLVLQYEL